MLWKSQPEISHNNNNTNTELNWMCVVPASLSLWWPMAMTRHAPWTEHLSTQHVMRAYAARVSAIALSYLALCKLCRWIAWIELELEHAQTTRVCFRERERKKRITGCYPQLWSFIIIHYVDHRGGHWHGHRNSIVMFQNSSTEAQPALQRCMWKII